MEKSSVGSSSILQIESEGEEEDINLKGTQAGRGTFEPNARKRKIPKIKTKISYEKCEEPPVVVLDFEKTCASHSFCVVESLKRKGVFPIQPKGLPWASGRLLYLPGQRPKHYDKTLDELAAIEKKKKKKKKDIRKEKKRTMDKLRYGDHVKLCDVMSTTQELMLLMRLITMVMERKRLERRKILASVQTSIEAIPEENESETEGEFKVPEEMEDMEEEVESEAAPDSIE